MTELAAPSSQGLGEERRTSPLELLWDLVFVFAVTQVTALLSANLTWTGFGQSMLVLALIWWAWSAFVWAANAQAANSPSLRACLLLATLFILIAGLAVPQAFHGEGMLFAVAYTVVRLLHLALYADASRRGDAAWSAIAGFALTVGIGMALLVVGSLLEGGTRVLLGESIVTIGVGARHEGLSVAVVAAVSLGLLITVGLWWTYFDRSADAAERRLREHGDPVLTAADAYSYLHLVIVAGIIVFAVGVNGVVHAVSEPLRTGARLALCGGVALYLLGHVAFRLRLMGELGRGKAVVAVALLVLALVGGWLPAWSVAAAIMALLALLCVGETASAAA